MFILYPLLIALALGLLTGGDLSRLGQLRLRLWWLALVGLVVQVVLFSPAVTTWIGQAGPALYVASSAVVLVPVAINLRLPGMVLILLGGVSNQLAIIANGGYMPTTLAAMQAAGLDPRVGYSNSKEAAAPVLGFLTDIFALPSWLPFSNIFSIGDTLIGIGIAILVFRTMRRPTSAFGEERTKVPPAPRIAPTQDL